MQRCQRACKAGVTAAFADAMTWCHVDRPPVLWIEIAAHRVVERRESKAAAKLRLERARHCAHWDMVRAACQGPLRGRGGMCQPLTPVRVRRRSSNPRRFKPTSKPDAPRNTTPRCRLVRDWGRAQLRDAQGQQATLPSACRSCPRKTSALLSAGRTSQVKSASLSGETPIIMPLRDERPSTAASWDHSGRGSTERHMLLPGPASVPGLGSGARHWIGKHQGSVRLRAAPMIAQLTKDECRVAFVILLLLAACGLAMTFAGRDDPLGCSCRCGPPCRTC